MLDIEFLDSSNPEKSAALFHQDGFVAVRDALTPTQLSFAQSGARRVITEQMEKIPLDKANRGFVRYSFGSQIHHPEWAQLVDLSTVLPILEAIWQGSEFICIGSGGDYSVPGAKIQHLHSDIGDVIKDPLQQVNIRDLPPPFIVVNFPLVEFKEINGAIRFIRSTQRSRQPIPTLENELEWMKQSILVPRLGQPSSGTFDAGTVEQQTGPTKFVQ